jgi:branched-chain amino acid transport system substrate-binding protein
VYFASVESAGNAAFLAAYARAFPAGPTVSADAEASYNAVAILAEALGRAASDSIDAVLGVVGSIAIDAPQGPVRIDPATMHAHLTPRIGRSNGRARFDVVTSAAQPVAPDPYLLESTPRFAVAPRSRHLRIVP